MNTYYLKFLYLLGYQTPLSIGKCFHYGNYVKKNTIKARTYYQQAINQGNLEAFQQLSILVNEEGCIGESYYYLGLLHQYKLNWQAAIDNYLKAAENLYADAMYQIGTLYKSDKLSSSSQCIIKKNLTTELNWYIKAAKLYSAYAINALDEMSESEPEAAFLFGQLYEAGEIGGKINIIAALRYYKKAAVRQHTNAALKLGYLYEYGYPGISIQKRKAIDYYIIAANKGSLPALTALERLINQASASLLWLKLSEIYLQIFNNKFATTKCIKHLIDKNELLGLAKIVSLTKTDPDYSYILAKLYEEDSVLENHLQKACEYYVSAAQQGHIKSLQDLKSLAKSGNSSAQYYLGYRYYHAKQLISEAITWCLLAADQQHPEAIEYLNNTNFSGKYYYQIAKSYLKGKLIQINMISAINFYVKACDDNYVKAALKLGQLYETGYEGVQPQISTAIKYFLKAATQRSKPALLAAKKLIEQADNHQLQLRLADIQFQVFKNKPAALLLLKALIDKNNLTALEKIGFLITEDANNAYLLGKLYQEDNSQQNNITQACWYYSKASQNGHKQAFYKLESLAKSGNADAQYSLGYDYHQSGQVDKAITYCLLAAKQAHTQAIAYLSSTKFNANQYYRIGKCYEEGRDAQKNIICAIAFYQKAFKLNNSEAALRLGRLYESGYEGIEPKNQQAIDYYLIAAAQHCEIALISLERIIESVGTDQQRLQLALLYLKVYNNKLAAVKCFKFLSNKASLLALEKIESLIKNDNECCYLLGELYEKDTDLENHIEEAGNYYLIAAKNADEKALLRLESLARSGNSGAQYKLGSGYYRYKNDSNNAIKWCLLAMQQNHAEAIFYINNARFNLKQYLQLAEYYEKETTNKNNLVLAIKFYEKALYLNSSKAALRLAQLYQLDINRPNFTQNNEKSCEYFIMAAKLGEHDALAPLERLSEEVSPVCQLKIGDMHRDPPFNDKSKASFYYQLALEGGSNQAQQRLDDLSKKISFVGGSSNLFSKDQQKIPNQNYSNVIKKFSK